MAAGISIKERSVNKSGSGGRAKFSVNDLPFPSDGRSEYQKDWRIHFRSTIINWAGASKDVYKVNMKLSADIVYEIWELIYLDFELDDDTKEESLKGILSLVCHHIAFALLLLY